MTKRAQKTLENAKWVIRNTYDKTDEKTTREAYEKIAETLAGATMFELIKQEEVDEVLNELSYFTLKIMNNKEA